MSNPLGRRDDLEVQEVGDELIVYDLRHDRAHCLHPVTAAIWRSSDGTKSVERLVELIRAQDPEADENLVWLALDALAEAELLDRHVAPPAGVSSLSRREMIRDLTAAGALGAMPFAIKSLIAPTPAEAQSGRPPEEEAEGEAGPPPPIEEEGEAGL